MDRSKQTLYDTHINMYPPPKAGNGYQRTTANTSSRTVPYPVEDAQQPMSPIPLQSAVTSQSIKSNSTQGTLSRIATPTNSRYDQPFTFQNPPPATFSTDSLNNRDIANNSSVDTFQSASDVSVSAAPPPPYLESENSGETPRFLQEKLYRKFSDLGETAATSNKPESKSKTVKTDLSQFSETAQLFHSVYEATIRDSPKFTPAIQMKWCETLLQYAFIDEFVSNYTINADKLKRTLTSEEALKNQKIILEHALKVLTKLITMDYGPALYLMATFYSHQPYLEVKMNSVIARNDVKALDYYGRAAALDVSDACFRAGVCYEYQRGTPSDWSRLQSMRKAISYYEKGALNSKHVACMYKLGMFCLHGVKNENDGALLLPQDVIAAIGWFKRAVRNDEKMGHASGKNGASADVKSPSSSSSSSSLPTTVGTAAKEDLVSPQAMYELAKIYEFDNLAPALRDALAAAGVSRNPTLALQYHHRCATCYSYPLAQWRLGQCYEFGHLNLPVVANKSIAWYAKAAMAKPRGNPMAMMALSGWYLTGVTGVLKPNKHEAFNWARKACLASDGKLARAEYALGFFYENGFGCTVNTDNAIDHYTKAAQAGHQKAQDRLRSAHQWRIG
ncbi:LADA_0D06700g1_1 [Lachancea dasiensis]|uniref:LADA_0D06700g1_1 n=1 Tax=Lachancea dasiensis TaxID=1072105 RepID=A0A1G4J647_9SACH|nr:LADA_0D06700g1_1 [Lachancea dasiensis]